MSKAKPPQKTATKNKPSIFRYISTYLNRHAQSMMGSLGRLYKNLVSSLLTITVIGIALALPAALFVILTNVHDVIGKWNPSPKISMYLTLGTDHDSAMELSRKVGVRAEVKSTEYISPDQGLAEISELTGVGDIAELLGENPLPAVIVVEPNEKYQSAARLIALQSELERLPLVDIARLDLDWVNRLHAYMTIARHATIIVSILLCLAVLLIVGNTIRLEIFNRKQEIIICKLIGATNTFIRRPFLYSGMWYGLLGGLLAWILLIIGVSIMQDSVAQLSAAYNSNYALHGLALTETLILLVAALLLGLFGSFIAVSRHLKHIEPE